MRMAVDIEEELYDQLATEIDRLQPEVWHDDAMRAVIENVVWAVALGLARGLVVIGELSESPDTVGIHPNQETFL